MNRSSHRPRFRRVASLFVVLAGLAGLANAVEFDEKAAAPLMKDAAALRAQAQGYATRFASFNDAGAEQLISSRALAHEQFDLSWQIQQAIDVGRPLGDLSAVGLVSRGDGSIRIDFNAFPQWERADQKLADVLPKLDLAAFSKQLAARGMTAAEAAALKTYLDTHDARVDAAARALPVSLGFSKVVKKYDRIKRPVPDATVLSYLYQRELAASDATREWAAGLLAALQPHGARILLSALNEGASSAVWGPSNQSAGIADILATVRLPDYEQRATAEARGDTP
jgi:hypothetical protein